jgi:hypothetical protein
MARRHRKHRRKHGFGNIISVHRGVDGLFDTGTVVGDALPVLLGAGAVVATTALVKKFVPASGTAGLSDNLRAYAPMVGSAVGALAGLGLVYGMGKRSAGTALMASSVVMGGVLQYGSKLGLSGFGAIVPEYSGVGMIMPQMQGLGATVLEDWPAGQRPDSIGALGDAYGTSINLSGLGAVNTSAFGTPGFQA